MKTLKKIMLEEMNKITGIVVDAAMDVHSALGPGLLESVYEQCLAHELELRGLKVERQAVSYTHLRGFCFDSFG